MTHDRFPRFPRQFASRSDFGRFGMRWGTGEEAALARIPELTREYLISIDLTLDMAREWVEFYELALEKDPRNFSARGRIPLMQHSVELLED
jgi:hypothetical protein